MTRAIPALVVGLTALATGALVHAGYGLWWLARRFLDSQPAAYDWNGALVWSGVATAVVLVVALLASRMTVGGASNSPVESNGPREATPARAAVRDRAL